jgi:MoaA/NifB/PqqE/SkfB family radical SAM enzyme
MLDRPFGPRRINMEKILNKQINLNRIEFFITYNCTSHCDHCSVYTNSIRSNCGPIDINIAEKVIIEANDNYNINSVMTFGGEPLLYPELVYTIHKTAKKCGIPVRQIITNGCWSNTETRIDEIVSMIADSDVNNILVSIDCFHEKYLNYKIVKYSIEQLKRNTKANIKLHPVWLVNKDDNNTYNERTKKILMEFDYLKIPVSSGNILFPAGRAIENLSEYLPKPSKSLTGTCKDQPYSDMPNNIESICIEPNGDIIACNRIGNIYENQLSKILNDYDYLKDPVLKEIVKNGCEGIYSIARDNSIELSSDGYYSICELCKDVSIKLNKKNV